MTPAPHKWFFPPAPGSLLSVAAGLAEASVKYRVIRKRFYSEIKVEAGSCNEKPGTPEIELNETQSI